MIPIPSRTAATAHLRDKAIEPERDFLSRIAQECRRAERSGQRFVLALVEGTDRIEDLVPYLTVSLAPIIRETDSWGWYEENYTLGILFTELGKASTAEAQRTLEDKLHVALEQQVERGRLVISSFAMPRDLKEENDADGTQGRMKQNLRAMPGNGLLGIKRAIDILGSAALLLIFSPFLLAVALAVKLSSPGPMLFRQTRVGAQGKHFTFLKFRSMRVASDQSVHESYVKQFIAGTAGKKIDASGQAVYKLVNDPRVTRVGDFIRRTSLDELPQLWNVLVGDMSLVGPRPPIPYEVDCYDLWHQRRLTEVKPGITGLWQVYGRSKTCFDDMVRLDLEYARTWSLWLDIKILLQTPIAVLIGVGAR
ncbi:MAG: sugar transferase [Acidobacteriota bacterium]|nr:sugar transferase [Acidobacteriota bacterium]